jgi:hypothetical protein
MNPKLHENVEEPRLRQMKIENVKCGHKNWFAREMILNRASAIDLQNRYGISNKTLSKWKNKVL